MMVDIVYKVYGTDIPMTIDVDNSQEYPEIMSVIEIGGVNVYDLLNGATREGYHWDRVAEKKTIARIPVMEEIGELVAAELEELRHEKY